MNSEPHPQIALDGNLHLHQDYFLSSFPHLPPCYILLEQFFQAIFSFFQNNLCLCRDCLSKLLLLLAVKVLSKTSLQHVVKFTVLFIYTMSGDGWASQVLSGNLLEDGWLTLNYPSNWLEASKLVFKSYLLGSWQLPALALREKLFILHGFHCSCFALLKRTALLPQILHTVWHYDPQQLLSVPFKIPGSWLSWF